MRADPCDVVIAPLDVRAVMRHEQIKDLVRIFPAVENVADDMQRIDGKPLDRLRERNDKALGAIELDDRNEDLMIIRLFVKIGAVHIDQFVDDVTEILGQIFSHLAAGIFGSDVAAKLNEPVQLNEVPVFQIVRLPLHFRDERLRIIDESRKLIALLFRHRISVELFHLLADDARAVVHDVTESFVLTVQIAHEMLRTLGQAHDGFEIDDLGGRRARRGVFFGKQSKIFFFEIFFFHFPLPYDFHFYFNTAAAMCQ